MSEQLKSLPLESGSYRLGYIGFYDQVVNLAFFNEDFSGIFVVRDENGDGVYDTSSIHADLQQRSLEFAQKHYPKDRVERIYQQRWGVCQNVAKRGGYDPEYYNPILNAGGARVFQLQDGHEFFFHFDGAQFFCGKTDAHGNPLEINIGARPTRVGDPHLKAARDVYGEPEKVSGWEPIEESSPKPNEPKDPLAEYNFHKKDSVALLDVYTIYEKVVEEGRANYEKRFDVQSDSYTKHLRITLNSSKHGRVEVGFNENGSITLRCEDRTGLEFGPKYQQYQRPYNHLVTALEERGLKNPADPLAKYNFQLDDRLALWDINPIFLTVVEEGEPRTREGDLWFTLDSSKHGKTQVQFKKNGHILFHNESRKGLGIASSEIEHGSDRLIAALKDRGFENPAEIHEPKEEPEPKKTADPLAGFDFHMKDRVTFPDAYTIFIAVIEQGVPFATNDSQWFMLNSSKLGVVQVKFSRNGDILLDSHDRESLVLDSSNKDVYYGLVRALKERGFENPAEKE